MLFLVKGKRIEHKSHIKQVLKRCTKEMITRDEILMEVLYDIGTTTQTN